MRRIAAFKSRHRAQAGLGLPKMRGWEFTCIGYLALVRDLRKVKAFTNDRLEGRVEPENKQPGSKYSRSPSARRIFSAAVREVDFPDFVSGKVEHSELDVVSELKEEVASFAV